jgi:hypothetical protein
MKTDKLILYTNSRLTKALDIYRTYGFKVVPLDDHPTQRANIKMELILDGSK